MLPAVQIQQPLVFSQFYRQNMAVEKEDRKKEEIYLNMNVLDINLKK